jgi:hypothetical protein
MLPRPIDLAYFSDTLFHELAILAPLHCELNLSDTTFHKHLVKLEFIAYYLRASYLENLLPGVLEARYEIVSLVFISEIQVPDSGLFLSVNCIVVLQLIETK